LESILYDGDMELFIDTLRSIVMEKNISKENQEDLLGYIEHNIGSMNYGESIRNGSGAVEKSLGI